ncbi:hypothetical protein STRTUCAR8_00464 [Streptomyces turgidiscabies Car8]|uniref:Uncharacterized protein n=1 Tax=Streptomyces turgidiscabies (strain Car8) TaxID=698760 RepID=L7F1R4_STRT8|nr:hypothetical protein STRTUCAR8_00464 [Streptomyces turgidiscabies Car8]
MQEVLLRNSVSVAARRNAGRVGPGSTIPQDEVALLTTASSTRTPS